MARGNDGRKVFLKDRDYEAFLEGVAAARKRYPFYLYAYVLMSNHFHLLLEVQHYSTARVLQSLLTGYARRFNRTHRHRGHLFQGRYKAILWHGQDHRSCAGIESIGRKEILREVCPRRDG